VITGVVLTNDSICITNEALAKPKSLSPSKTPHFVN
jgi:hypothetical protein